MGRRPVKSPAWSCGDSLIAGDLRGDLRGQPPLGTSGDSLFAGRGSKG